MTSTLSAAEIESALKSALPPEQHAAAGKLAHLLVSRLASAGSSETPVDVSGSFTEFKPLLEGLAGAEIKSEHAVISFGKDNQFGDVKIGDVAGRDLFKANFTFNITQVEAAYDVRGLPNPFLGLQSFTYADRAKYGGRSREIAAAVSKLTAPDSPQSLLFVTGASGSGKSSFAQAGLLPALELHYGEFTVKHAVFRPSANPLAGLGDALWRQLGLPKFDHNPETPESFNAFLRNQTSPRQINLIVVDQFEELFTQSVAQPRDTLFQLLTNLPPFIQIHTHFIATMRADYLPELFRIPLLYEVAKRGVDLRAMSVDEVTPIKLISNNVTRLFYSQNHSTWDAQGTFNGINYLKSILLLHAGVGLVSKPEHYRMREVSRLCCLPSLQSCSRGYPSIYAFVWRGVSG